MLSSDLFEYLYSLARDDYHYELTIQSSKFNTRTVDIYVTVRDPKLAATVGGIAINIPARDMFVSHIWNDRCATAINDLQKMVTEHHRRWRVPPVLDGGCQSP